MKSPLLLRITLALIIAPLSAREPPGPEDFREVAGILSWTFDIHPDTADDEFYATEWLIPTKEGTAFLNFTYQHVAPAAD
jgi:hypothetical protein